MVTIPPPREVKRAGDPGFDPALAWEGRQLFLKLQCIKCHTEAGDAKGPSLVGLLGTKVQLAGDVTVVADEEYIIESILKPRAKVVLNFKPSMPSYEGQVTAEELNQLVAFIKSLKPAEKQPPPVGAPTGPHPPVAPPPREKPGE